MLIVEVYHHEIRCQRGFFRMLKNIKPTIPMSSTFSKDMENAHFDEFRKVEMKMFTLEQVKDNLQLVADGFRFKYEDPSSSNAIELNIGVMEKTLDELKWLFSKIEETSPENWGLDADQEENAL